MRFLAQGCVGVLLAVSLGSVAAGQTTLTGANLTFNSYNIGPGTNLLDGPGYMGTYLDVIDSGDGGSLINLNMNAARGAGGAGPDPHMNIVIADSKFGFTVSNTSSTNYASGNFWMPAGRYVVRAERDTPNNPTSATRTVTLSDLNVSAVTGSATFNNSNTNANALAAADSYIANFRKGDATIKVQGVAPGTAVQITQVQDAFNFGTNVHGTSTALFSNADYVDHVVDHFNTMVPSRMGKWNNQESTQDVVSMTGLDAYYDFAEANGLRKRAHTLIWGNTSGSHEQPAWAVTMLNSGSTAQHQALRTEISERIDYYVGDGDGDTNDGDFSQRYEEIDIYNESWHTGANPALGANNYWDRLGPAAGQTAAQGIASVYEEAGQAIAAAGSNAKLYVNEYSVIQDNADWDNYSNEYREHIELIQNADGDPSDGPVEGVGVQYWAINNHSTSYMQQVLQNLNTTGLQLTLTEHGVQGSVATNSALSEQIVTETLRMIFGNPNAVTHMIWGVWRDAQDAGLQGGAWLWDDPNTSPGSLNDWVLSNVGEAYEDLRGLADHDGNPNNGFRTNLNTTVNANGEIEFNGFYGDYIITIDGDDYALSLNKGGQVEFLLPINPGDFDYDGDVDADDIDILFDNQGANPLYDLDGDDDADHADVNELVNDILGTTFGDADLDGDVDGADFDAWRIRDSLGDPIGWATGDWDGDGDVDGGDFDLWRERPDSIPGGDTLAAVPEPATAVLLGLALPAMALVARRRNVKRASV